MTARLLLLLAAALTLGASPRGLTHYPRRYLDLQITGTGYPVLDSAGALRPLVLDSIARYDVVVADAGPLRERPDIAAALAKRNPNLIVLAYLAGQVWNNPHPGLGDSTTYLYAKRWSLVRDYGALLYDTTGRPWGSDGNYDNVDRANHRAMLALADLDATCLVPGVSGLFLDVFTPTILWQQYAGHQIDYRRAGYETLGDWDRAFHEGHRIYAERLRKLVGDALLVGNGGPSGERDVLNGWMREGFCYQNGGTWDTNMLAFGSDPGYLRDGGLYRQPALMFLSSWAPANPKQARKEFLFGLASASLGDGCYQQFAAGPRTTGFPWPPEYSMDLGAPLTPAFRTGTWKWRREFERGYVECDSYNYTGKVVQR